MTVAKRPAPISSHPAFKWGVGAWFALLLGLGLFVMPAQVHLLIAERLGLDRVLSDPAMIRLALAAGAALLGLALGLVIALRVTALNEAGTEIEEDDLSALDADGDAETEAVAGSDIWLPDAAPARETPSRRTSLLRTPAARPPEPPQSEPLAQGPQVKDAPRRPFNPREDIGEEGIAPFRPDSEPAPFAGEGFAERHDDQIVLQGGELVPEDPYFSAAWDMPQAPEAEAEPEAGADDAANEPQADPDPDPATSEDEAAIILRAPELAADAAPEDTPPAPQPPEPAPAAQSAAPSPAAAPATALGDLPLEALTARLESVLAAAKASPSSGKEAESDPVIAFLRREAEREPSTSGNSPHSGDPQAELRSALDKLSRVAKPK